MAKVQYLVTVNANMVASFNAEVAGHVLPQGSYGDFHDFIVTFEYVEGYQPFSTASDKEVATSEMKRQLRKLQIDGIVYSYKPYFAR